MYVTARWEATKVKREFGIAFRPLEDTLDLVMMDRKFDSKPAKKTCEEYNVHYLNPTRIFTNSDEAETTAWMYRTGKRFHAEEESDGDTPTRKHICLPKRSNSDDNEDREDDLSAV